MTSEEAIELLDNLTGMVEDNQNSDYDTALKMAIKVLEQEPCEDAVSRKAVDLLCFEFLRANSDDNCAFYERFRDLPAVTPTRKSGLRWIERFDNEDKWLECPHCHMDSTEAHNYCPHCGADMRGGENETN